MTIVPSSKKKLKPVNNRGEAIAQFLKKYGLHKAERKAIPGDASFRRYERIKEGPRQVILMDAPPGKEDVKPFIKIAEFLRTHGFGAPEILARDELNGFLLLEDARRDVPKEVVDRMLKRYMDATIASKNDEEKDKFTTSYAVMGAQRNCKIIGIFARLAVRDGKTHYLEYLPRVWKHLEHDLEHPVLEPLSAWLDEHIPYDFRGPVEIA